MDEKQKEHVKVVLDQMQELYRAEMVPEDDMIHTWILRLMLALDIDPVVVDE